jgi:hypothetical protein
MSAWIGFNHGLMLDVTRRRYYAVGDNTYVLRQLFSCRHMLNRRCL